MDKDKLVRTAKIRLSQLNFWHYCKLMAPEFYKDSRPFLKSICDEFQDFYNSKDTVMIVNVAPRHGKSRTATLFSQWLFGVDKHNKIIIGSYNSRLSSTFSKGVRDTIMETTLDPNRITYHDIFPNTVVKRGDGAVNNWSLEDSYSNYLATSPGGTVTGFGAKTMIIDDLVKNSYEAYNDRILDEHFEWYTKTMLSRLENGGKVIIIGTRWSDKDLSGRLIEYYNDKGVSFRHIKIAAFEEGKILCDEILSLESYLDRVDLMGEDIANANYNQICSNKKGRLLTKFVEYGTMPEFEEICSYTDTADTGEDNLCHIVYGRLNDDAYILDVIYTDEGMSITEKLVANSILEYNVDVADIESNNGGRGFSRAVEKIVRDADNYDVHFNNFHQSDNKEARILSNSNYVQNHIFYPNNFKNRYPNFYKEISEYMRTGKNKHDDGIDVLTGIAEKLSADKRKVLFY